MPCGGVFLCDLASTLASFNCLYMCSTQTSTSAVYTKHTLRPPHAHEHTRPHAQGGVAQHSTVSGHSMRFPKSLIE